MRETAGDPLSAPRGRGTRAVLLAVPILFWIAQEIHPFGPQPPAHRALALLLTMAFWWVTEALPIHWVATLPILVPPFFPMFPAIEKGKPDFAARFVENASAIGPAYVNPFIMVFMGGMLIGVAMEQHDLHRRIALRIMKAIGSTPRRILMGFIVATAFISMWISNTATAVMMVPIGLAVIHQLEEREGRGLPLLAQSIMLAIAYGANIGGIGTLIGTPPNMQLAGFVAGQYKIQVTFLDYLLTGFPFVLLLLPVAYGLLAWLCRREETRTLESDILDRELEKLGRITGYEKVVLGVFGLTSSLWILNDPIRRATGLGLKSDEFDAIAALLAPLLLYLTGALRGGSLKRMPWDVLVLLGGSYALAQVVLRSGLSDWLGAIAKPAAQFGPLVLMGVVTVVTVLLTAFSANAAAANLMMILVTGMVDPAKTQPGRAIPYLFGVAMSSSLDFMLPCGTPPNAIVFGTRRVGIRAMAGAGLALDLLSALLLALWIWLAARHWMPGAP
jgi:sodium-dependent dicarboxylate transporter 2/3/5